MSLLHLTRSFNSRAPPCHPSSFVDHHEDTCGNALFSPSSHTQARVVLSYLHNYADTNKDGSLCQEEVLAALVPFYTPLEDNQQMQQSLMEVRLADACFSL